MSNPKLPPVFATETSIAFLASTVPLWFATLSIRNRMKFSSLSCEHQTFFWSIFSFDHPVFQATDRGNAHIFVSTTLNVRGLDRPTEDIAKKNNGAYVSFFAELECSRSRSLNRACSSTSQLHCMVGSSVKVVKIFTSSPFSFSDETMRTHFAVNLLFLTNQPKFENQQLKNDWFHAHSSTASTSGSLPKSWWHINDHTLQTFKIQSCACI